MNVMAKGGVALRRARLPRAWHDGRHQRDHRAQGRQDGADHDRGLPRLARDRARQPARLLQPRTTRSRRRSCRATCAARCRAASRTTASSGGRSTSTGCPRSSTTSSADGVEAVAICLLHAYANPAHEQAVLAQAARALARGLGGRLAPDHPRVARVRAHQHDGALGLRAAGRRALPDAARVRRLATRASAASSTSCSRTAASTRSRRRSRSRSRWSSRARRAAFWGAAELGRLIGEPERARARHRRHDGEVLADRGRPREDHDRLLDRAQPARPPATRSWCRSSTWSRSATAAAASPGSTTSGSSTSGRNRPAPFPARSPTAAAATRGDDDRRQSRARADQPRLLLRRRDRRRHGGGRDGARRASPNGSASTATEAARGVDPHRQQQHGQRAEARLA